MGALLACCACETASCCASLACSCCGRAFSYQKSVATKTLYLVIFLITAIFSWIILNWGQSLFTWAPEISICGENNSSCYGVLATIRITFSLTLFHLILAILFIGLKSSKDVRS